MDSAGQERLGVPEVADLAGVTEQAVRLALAKGRLAGEQVPRGGRVVWEVPSGAAAEWASSSARRRLLRQVPGLTTLSRAGGGDDRGPARPDEPPAPQLPRSLPGGPDGVEAAPDQSVAGTARRGSERPGGAAEEEEALQRAVLATAGALEALLDGYGADRPLADAARHLLDACRSLAAPPGAPASYAQDERHHSGL